jgi:hypothetical protein
VLSVSNADPLPGQNKVDGNEGKSWHLRPRRCRWSSRRSFGGCGCFTRPAGARSAREGGRRRSQHGTPVPA